MARKTYSFSSSSVSKFQWDSHRNSGNGITGNARSNRGANSPRNHSNGFRVIHPLSRRGTRLNMAHLLFLGRGPNHSVDSRRPVIGRAKPMPTRAQLLATEPLA